MDMVLEIMMAAGAAVQTINLFLAGYLLKRTDTLAADLVYHERNCIMKREKR